MVWEGFQAGGPAPALTTGTVLTDTFFKCSESPISLTRSQLNTIIRNQSSLIDKYNVSALVSGNESLTTTANGYSISGSVANGMIINSTRYTWNDTRFFVPGAHQVISTDTGLDQLLKGAAEFQVYFKNDTNPTDFYCICIPILKGRGRGMEYFRSLGILQRKRPSFTTLWTESTGFLQYVAKDLRNRTEAKCTNDGNKITYLVAIEPAYIDPVDFSRLSQNLTTAQGYNAASVPNAQTVSNKSTLISYIPSIEIAANTETTRQVGNGYVETTQVKCRPLDQRRDISGNLIYVGGKERRGDTSLDKELARAADMSGGFEEPTATIQGSDIETILGIVLGVVIGIVVVAFLVVGVFRKTETHYTKVLKEYSSAGFEKASKAAEAAWKKIVPEPCMKVVEKAVTEAVSAAKQSSVL